MGKSPSRDTLLSPTEVAVLSTLYTISYVLPFYLFRTTRPSPALRRDSPSLIKARVQLVSASCLVSAALTLLFLRLRLPDLSLASLAHLLGWWPPSLPDIWSALVLTTTLFAAPLFEQLVVDGDWDLITPRAVVDELRTWVGWRNYVAGPISEELLFRSLLVPLHLLSLYPVRSSAALSVPVSVRDLVGTRSHLLYLTVLPPLYFGIAHIHHFYEFRLTHPSVPLVSAVVRSALQLAYTTLFGAYASYLFLKTGSLPAVIILHVFCNWVGLPRLWGRVGGTVMAATADIAATSSGPGRSEGDRGQEESEEEDEERNDVHTDSTPGGLDCAHKHAPHLHPVARLSDLWTASYYFLLVAGAYAFGHGLMAFRSSQNALITR